MGFEGPHHQNDMKKCSGCKQVKSAESFPSDSSRGDGLNYYCRECDAAVFTKLKKKAFKEYGGAICINCGEDFFAALVLDHIDNDGAEHRKKVGSGHRVYYDLQKKKWPKGLQVLCYICNQLKQRQPHLLSEYAKSRGKK